MNEKTQFMLATMALITMGMIGLILNIPFSILILIIGLVGFVGYFI